MASNLQVENVLTATAQSVKDQNGKTSPFTLSTDKVGVGTTEPGSALHVEVGDSQQAAASLRISGTFPGLSFYANAGAGEARNWAIAAPWFHNGDFSILQSNKSNGDPREEGVARLHINAAGNVGIGTTEPQEKLVVIGNILATGDIRLSNADCAEDFTIGTDVLVEPGTVMVLGEEDGLYPSQHAYDKRVAGVVSGAGDYKPGIVLDKQTSERTRQPIALLGKVYCKVDAQYASIEVGDLLTTSDTVGHAMKACDPVRAFGAVVGKALGSLTDGRGLIPILITLQ